MKRKTHSSPPGRNPPEKNTCGLFTYANCHIYTAQTIVAFSQFLGVKFRLKQKRKKEENSRPPIFPSFLKKLAKCPKKMWKMFRHKLDFGFSLVAFLLDQCFFWWQISQLGDFFFPVRK
jgi:hypothetical protein